MKTMGMVGILVTILGVSIVAWRFWPQGQSTPSTPTFNTSVIEDQTPRQITQKDWDSLVNQVNALTTAQQQWRQSGVSKDLLEKLFALQDLKFKINQGLPFTAELKSYEDLVPGSDFTQIQNLSEAGIPNLPTLVAQLIKMGPHIALVIDSQNNTGWFSNLSHWLKKTFGFSSTKMIKTYVTPLVNLVKQGQLQEARNILTRYKLDQTGEVGPWMDGSLHYETGQAFVRSLEKSLTEGQRP
jgi:hypothetical protein